MRSDFRQAQLLHDSVVFSLDAASSLLTLLVCSHNRTISYWICIDVSVLYVIWEARGTGTKITLNSTISGWFRKDIYELVFVITRTIFVISDVYSVLLNVCLYSLSWSNDVTNKDVFLLKLTNILFNVFNNNVLGATMSTALVVAASVIEVLCWPNRCCFGFEDGCHSYH